MKIFSYRDNNFDLPRSFLVLSMIISHVFQSFYVHDYNRHLTYYVLLGFVFLSGFTLTAAYQSRIVESPWLYSKRMMIRGLRVFLVFIICNIIIMFFFSARFEAISQKSFLDICSIVFLGTEQNLIAFEVLVPISVTISICGILVVLLRNCTKKVPGIFLLWFLIVLSEVFDIMNFYSIKLVLVGMIGCIAGNLAVNLDWTETIEKITKKMLWVYLLGIGVLLYFLWAMVIGKLELRIPLMMAVDIGPTVGVLSLVYILSVIYNLSEKSLIKLLNNTLSRFMLFAYLFHLLLINLLFFIILENSLNLYRSICVSALVLCFTVLICYALDELMLKFKFIRNVYRYVFG